MVHTSFGRRPYLPTTLPEEPDKNEAPPTHVWQGFLGNSRGDRTPLELFWAGVRALGSNFPILESLDQA